jgi:putative protein-disulfide isomerase
VPRFHYLYDPLCGWCYAAEPLVAAAMAAFGARIELVLHGGGLFAQPTRLSDSFRRHVVDADGRIASLTGQTFSPAYFEKLLPNPSTVFYSLPPIAAVRAAQRLDARRALDFLFALQRAHYVEARRIVELEVQIEVAAAVGFEPAAFRAQREREDGEATAVHLRESAGLMRRLGASGFPAFAVEVDRAVPVDHFRYYGKPQAFVDRIGSLIRT